MRGLLIDILQFWSSAALRPAGNPQVRRIALALLLVASVSRAGPGEVSRSLGADLGGRNHMARGAPSALLSIPRLGGGLQQNSAAGAATDSGNIRWAHRFPASDLGAQINAADSSLGKDAGVIWVTRPGTVVTPVNLTAHHDLHLFAATTWKAGIVVQDSNTVAGEGCASLVTLALPGPGPLITANKTSNLRLANLCAEAPPQTTGLALVTTNGSRGVEVTGCSTTNIRLAEFDFSFDVKVIGNTAVSARSDAPAGAAVLFNFAQGAVASDNVIHGFAQGFQWWGGDANPQKGQGAAVNERGARNLSFVGNTVSNVGAGGIWGSMGEGIVASGNTIETCGDVCLDSEGSNAVVFANNYVKDGANGAITTFYYNRDVLISGNTVVSSSTAKPLLRTYTTGQTAPYDRDVQVVGNHFTCLDATPCFINSVSGLPERFTFQDNTLRNVTLDISDANPKHFVVISNNDFLFDVPVSRVPGAITVARTYSLAPGVPGSCDISNNSVRSNVPQPPGSTAILVFQDDPDIPPLTMIEGNRLFGLHPFPIDIKAGGGSKNPAVTPLFLIRNNLMGAGVFLRLDQANPRSVVKLEGNYRADFSPLPGQ